MISLSEIKRLAVQCGAETEVEHGGDELIYRMYQGSLSSFANACYATGQDAQRESDAKLCDAIAKECGCWEEERT